MKKPSNDCVPEDEMVMAEALAYEAQVERENERFAKMSPAEKRVRIAQDVILWLRAGRINPRSVYLQLDNYSQGVDKMPDKVDGIRCDACALGSIFAVAAERGLCSINIDARWVASAGYMRERLSPYFSNGQLVLIEDVFEGAGLGASAQMHNYFSDLDEELGYRTWRAACMAAIMLNIIDNDGWFYPSKFNPKVDGPRAVRAVKPR